MRFPLPSRALAGALALAGAAGADEPGLLGFGDLPGGPAAPAAAAVVPWVPTEDAVRAALRAALEAQVDPPRADRHALRMRLELAGPAPVAPTLVVAFEGTGAFEPRVAPAMLQLRGLGALPRDIRPANLVREELEALEGREARWSGLQSGPLTELLRDPRLLPGGYHWASFPSEELELLAGEQALKEGQSYLELMDDVLRSRGSRPRGVLEAVEWLQGALDRCVAAGFSPRVVVVTHSSGGRSAVKFLEHLQGRKDPRTGAAPTRVELVFSIDPVREAHEALKELAGGAFAHGPEGAEVAGGGDHVDPADVPTVAHQAEPPGLYKPANADRWVSVFQRVDTRGLKVEGLRRHGIHGSKVRGAEVNQEIELDEQDDKASGHGAIATDGETIDLWRQELRALAARPARPRPRAPRSPRVLAAAFGRAYLATPLREWREAPWWADMTEANHFAEALVAGAKADPAGYEAFRQVVHAATGDPVVDWFRYSWNQYLRGFHRVQARRKQRTGRRQRQKPPVRVDGRSVSSWKREAEANMKKVSKGVRAAFHPSS